MQCGAPQLHLWSRKIPHTAEQLSPCTPTTEAICCNYWGLCALESVLCNMKGLQSKAKSNAQVHSWSKSNKAVGTTHYNHLSAHLQGFCELFHTFCLGKSYKVCSGLFWWLSGKESICQSRRCKRNTSLIHELGRSPGGLNGNPFQDSCLEKSYGQRSLAGYSPWGHKESDTAERLSTHIKVKRVI